MTTRPTSCVAPPTTPIDIPTDAAGTLSQRQPARCPKKIASTRGGRIRYDLRSVMRQRANQKKRQRDRAKRGRIVVGRFVLHAGRVILQAVRWEPGFWIILPAPLTEDFDQFARWNTRQAARQWLQRHPDPRCQLVNLEQLRGRED